MASQTSETQSPKPVTNPWIILLVLCLGFFMIMLDTTIVNIAIPAILDGFDTSLDQVLWVVNAYLLAYAVLLITAGRLGDIWGPRTLFIAGLIVFTLASAVCGFAQNPEQLIIARVVQGVGGALLAPQTLAIIATVFPAERRGAAMGVWGGVIGLATIAGPTLGGLLVDSVSWRWIFFVNIPIGLVCLVLTLRVVPDPRPGRQHRFDLTGMVLAGVGLLLLVYGLIEGQRYDWGEFWGPLTIPEAIGAGVVVLIAFVVYERRPAEPLLPLSLFGNRNFSVMNWVQCLIAFGMLGIYLPVVLVLQNALGMSPLRAGLTLVPLSVASIFAAPLSGRLADQIGGKYVLMVGLAVFALGTGLMIPAIAAGSTLVDFLLPNIVAGLGLGLCLAPLTAEAMRDITLPHLGAASGMLNTTRQVGSVLGTAVVGAVLQSRLDGTPAENVAAQQQATPDAFVNAFVHAARPTLWVPIAVLLVALISCLAAVGRRSAAAGTPAADATSPQPASSAG